MPKAARRQPVGIYIMREKLRGLIAAIVADDRAAVAQVLRVAPTLVTAVVDEGHYESRLAHWIYAGDTALHVAAAGHRVEIARILLDFGAKVDAAGNHLHAQPLHYAADDSSHSPSETSARRAAMLQLLLDAGAEIDAPDKNGATALHHAVRDRCVTAVKVLLAARADAAIRNKSGSTAFHLAVQNLDRRGLGVATAQAAQRDIIAAFLEHGVSSALLDAKGRTVFDAARSAWIREQLTRFGQRL